MLKEEVDALCAAFEVDVDVEGLAAVLLLAEAADTEADDGVAVEDVDCAKLRPAIIVPIAKTSALTFIECILS